MGKCACAVGERESVCVCVCVPVRQHSRMVAGEYCSVLIYSLNGQPHITCFFLCFFLGFFVIFFVFFVFVLFPRFVAFLLA